MCTGFSYVGFSSFVLGNLHNLIGNFLDMKSNFEIVVMDSKVIKVENRPYFSEEKEKSYQVEITTID